MNPKHFSQKKIKSTVSPWESSSLNYWWMSKNVWTYHIDLCHCTKGCNILCSGKDLWQLWMQKPNNNFCQKKKKKKKKKSQLKTESDYCAIIHKIKMTDSCYVTYSEVWDSLMKISEVYHQFWIKTKHSDWLEKAGYGLMKIWILIGC